MYSQNDRKVMKAVLGRLFPRRLTPKPVVRRVRNMTKAKDVYVSVLG